MKYTSYLVLKEVYFKGGSKLRESPTPLAQERLNKVLIEKRKHQKFTSFKTQAENEEKREG